MVSFESDYIAGAHPAIIKRLTETNLESLPGYGSDDYSISGVDHFELQLQNLKNKTTL